jgi:hypothetical protein
MDPTTALAELLQAIADKDAWTILDRLDALRTWIDRGGFIPNLPDDVRALVR